MYQAHAQQLLNQKESEHPDSGDSFMSDDSQHPLTIATRRLVAALDRLEGNIQYVTAQPEAAQQEQLAFFEQENEELRVERENLNTAISQLQYQYTDLHDVASTIYGKLDDSIKRLTQLIDS